MRRMLAGLVTGVALCLAACGGPTQVSGANPIITTGQSGSQDGSSGGPTAPPAQPFTAPTDYTNKTWTFRPDPQNGGSSAVVRVPQNWNETKRADYWSDYLDPTGQVRLRVDVTAGLTGESLEQAPGAAASAELKRLKSADGFRSISERTLPPGEHTGSGSTEIVYEFTRDGQTVQCTYRFVGLDDITETRLGVYYPASDKQEAEKMLDAVTNSLAFAG